MATPLQVREYLALWFQLGKRVILPATQEAILPEPIFYQGSYSAEFETCWQRIRDPKNTQAYLEGTPQTIADLLAQEWEVLPCSRCEMPVPIVDLGLPLMGCPCHDLLSWPNTDIPMPRRAVDSQRQLSDLRSRLLNLAEASDPA